MRELFPEYVGLGSNADFLWSESVFVFDTNVLLGIHSWPEDEANWIIDEISEKLADRIWLPHQVALEFVRNRTVRLNDRINKINGLTKEVDKKIKLIKESVVSSFSNIRYKVNTESFPSVEDDIKTWVEGHTHELENEKNRLSGRLDIENDVLFARIEKLFKGRIGTPYSVDREKEIYDAGEYRYEKRIPPGYMDDKDKPEVWRKYGDLVMWMQIMDFACRSDIRSIILVTNDAKEDWINQSKMPNPLLVQEFGKVTGGKSFWLYNLEDFIKEAVSREVIVSNDRADEAIQEARQDVEEYKPYISPLALDVIKRIGEITAQTYQSNLISQYSEGIRSLQASMEINKSILDSAYSPSRAFLGQSIAEVMARLLVNQQVPVVQKSLIGSDDLSEEEVDDDESGSERN